MDFFDAVSRRYSYRGEFTGDLIPQEDTARILQAGIQAPSGGNRQTTNFIAVTDKSLRDEINSVLSHKGIATAPLLIAVYTQKVPGRNGKDYELQDFGAAMQTILLAAAALGYSSLWLEGYLYEDGRGEKAAEMLGLDSMYTLRAVIPVGTAKEEGVQNDRKPFEERVRFNRQ